MDVQLLRSLVTERYSPKTIPGQHDNEIAELVAGVASVAEFERIAARLDPASGKVLNLFARRAASLAVRLQSDSWVRYGLIAALLSATVEDYREIARTHSLLFRAAELIGSNPIVAFEAVAQLATSEEAEGARLFAHADESAKSISVMGYQEGVDDTGFRFISLW